MTNGINGHGKYAAPDNETSHARFPLPNPLPQAGEGANESLREFHVNTNSPNNAKDEDVRYVEAALRRAAQKARLIALQTHTPLVVVRKGKLTAEIPAKREQEA